MRLVVKVGSSTLTHSTGLLNIRLVEKLCKVLSDIKNKGNEIVLVSSGAVAMGVGKLNLLERPNDTPTKQAAAAVGQCELMYTYDKLFNEYNHTVAQLLITGNDVANTEHNTNIENTINRLLQLGALPIINENDTVSVDEIDQIKTLGDNDTLAAIIAVCANADLLILLSDIDGLYTDNPRENPNASLISVVYELNDKIMSSAGSAGSSLGTGGMRTKLSAAKIVCEKGIDMIIANGSNPERLYDIVDGKSVGTRFLSNKQA